MNSAKAERDQLRDRMCRFGCSVAQIAAEMSRRFNLRPRLAWRHALGWPQWKVAQEYNTLHAGAKLSDNRVSEFESWPHGGARPTVRYLVRLAVTYGHGCTPYQLVDADDLAQLNSEERCLLTDGHAAASIGTAAEPSPTARARRVPQVITVPVSRASEELVVPTDPAVWTAALGLSLPNDLAGLLMTFLGARGLTDDSDALLTPGELDRAYHQLVRFLTSWAHTMKRRLMLRTLGWAATAASLGYSLDPDEHVRVAKVLGNSSRIDRPTIQHIEAVLWHCTRQDDTLGPRAVLDTVLAQRDLARSLLPGCPATLRPRMLAVLSDASRKAGWLCFDLKNFDSAAYYYEDARVLADEAGDVARGAHVLRNMGHMAIWQDRPQISIDHAVAANQRIKHTGDMRLHAYCADGAAVAYAANGQRTACMTALDTAHAATGNIGEQPPGSLYAYDEAVHVMHRAMCHLRLRDAHHAADYAQRSLATCDQSYARDKAMTTIDLANAYVLTKEIDEAARLLGDAGEIAAHNSSARLFSQVRAARADLRPWAHTTAVRTLDDRLTSCGVAVA